MLFKILKATQYLCNQLEKIQHRFGSENFEYCCVVIRTRFWQDRSIWGCGTRIWSSQVGTLKKYKFCAWKNIVRPSLGSGIQMRTGYGNRMGLRTGWPACALGPAGGGARPPPGAGAPPPVAPASPPPPASAGPAHPPAHSSETLGE